MSHGVRVLTAFRAKKHRVDISTIGLDWMYHPVG